MARHQQPRELAELKGAHKLNPQRYRNEVPKSEMPLGEYPEVRSTDPSECWFEIASMCIPGVLTGADRIFIEVAANLLAEYREDHKKFPSAKLRDMTSCLARFGMSPADRQKLGVAKNNDGPVFGPL